MIKRDGKGEKRFTIVGLLLVVSFLSFRCQTDPTRTSEKELGMESRVFSKVKFGEKVDLSKAVIVDTRSRFQHELSRLPRSFHAYWKDWDLRGYEGEALELKVKELQRLLSLKGVDPLVQVVIVGEGLKGKGEEFLLATTLISLGIERITISPMKDLNKALLSKKIPPVENTPYWEKSIKYNFNCEAPEVESHKQEAEIKVGQGKNFVEAKEIFDKSLRLKKRVFPKTMNPQIYSKDNLWGYGVALHLKDQGRNPCVF